MFDLRILRSLGLLLAVLALVLVIGLRTAPISVGFSTPELYAVQSGDTLWSIATDHSSGDPRDMVWEIKRVNNLNSVLLTPGQILQIPTD